MLQSMTGFGAARAECDGFVLSIEAKSVNGRFLKTQVKLPSGVASTEAAIEEKLRLLVHRGTVTVHVHLTDTRAKHHMRLNEEAVRGYQAAFKRLGLPFDNIPLMPGVVQLVDEVLPAGLPEMVVDTAHAAFVAMGAMRRLEGKALCAVLVRLCDSLDANLTIVAQRAPEVPVLYRAKLQARIAQLLADAKASLDDGTLAREVALYADRCDITEEVDRLGAHVRHARAMLAKGGECGRSLEFLSQEMHREVNTMGSKSSDAKLAALIVNLKADVERFREQTANCE